MGSTGRIPAAGPALPPTSCSPLVSPHLAAPRPPREPPPLPPAPCDWPQPGLTLGRQGPCSCQCDSAAGVLGVAPYAGRFWKSLCRKRAFVPLFNCWLKMADSLKVGAFCQHGARGSNGMGSQELQAMSLVGCWQGGEGGPWRPAACLPAGLCQRLLFPTGVHLPAHMGAPR